MANYTVFTDLKTTASAVIGTTATIGGAATVGGALTVTGAISNTALDTKFATTAKFLKLGTIDFEDTSATPLALATAHVPAGAMITQIICNVTTAFDSGDSDTLSVGINGTVNTFLTTSDITATTIGGYTKIAAYESGEADLTVYATWTGAGTAATAGSADIYAVYFEE